MSKYQLLPPLSEAEFAALREDIAVAGVLVPIDVDEHGDILDGHHRKQACDELGIECPTRVIEGIPEFAKADYALTVNLARRHLDRAQRRQLVWNSVKAAPHLSDRQHARRCGVSPTTVGEVRKDLEAAEEVSKLDTRTDKRGREQPATKTAAGPLVPADGDERPAAGSTPAVGSGASNGDADRPEPAVNPEDSPATATPGEAAQEDADKGYVGARGDEADAGGSSSHSAAADREQEPEGVPAPAPTRILNAAAEEFGDLELDVLGRTMTDQELIEMNHAFERLGTQVALLLQWAADARLDQ